MSNRSSVVAVIALTLALPLASCKDDNEPAKSGTDPFGLDVSGASVALPAFGVVAEARPSLAVVGKPVVLNARVVSGDGAGASFSWKLPQAATAATSAGLTGQGLTVSFDGAGEHLVEVSVTLGGKTVTGGALVHVAADAQAPALGTLTGGQRPTQADVDLLDAHLHGTADLTAAQYATADLDLSGDVDSNDLSLLRAAVTAGARAPTYLSKSQGAALNPAFVIHDVLLDAGADVTVSLTTSTAGTWDQSCLDGMAGKPRADQIPAQRARPGYLVFAVPVRYACLKTDETVKVELVSGEKTVSIADSFVIKPLPAASAEPGWPIIETMGRLRVALAGLPAAIAAYADKIGASADEKATLQGTAKAAADQYAKSYADFYVAFQKLDRPTRAAWEQLARARGLDDLLARAKALTPNLTPSSSQLSQGLTIAAGEALLTTICAFNQIADIAGKVAEINESVASVLEWLDWWPLNRAPIVGPVISFLSATSNIVGAITDLIDAASKFVPQTGEQIQIRGKPAALEVGETSALSAHLEIKIATGLCNAGAGKAVSSFVDALTDRLTAKLGSMIPVANQAFKAAKYNRDEMGKIVGLVYDAIGYVAGKIVDATGVGEYLTGLASKVCGLLRDPTVPVRLDTLKASCGAVSDSAWSCSESCAAFPTPREVTLSGDKSVCGATKPASGALTCLGKAIDAGPADAGPARDGALADRTGDVATSDGSSGPCPAGKSVKGWRLSYNWGNCGTYFDNNTTLPAGTYSQTCYSTPQSATVTGSGTTFMATPQPGCFESQKTPCIYCGPYSYCGSGGGCASGTSVTLTQTAPDKWTGTCGSYKVTLWPVCG